MVGSLVGHSTRSTTLNTHCRQPGPVDDEGILYRQPPTEEARWAALDAEKERLRKKRDDARWYVIMGVALMFTGTVNAYFAVGGALSAVYGSVATLYWGRRLNRVDNPWEHDPELDAWEEEHFGP